MWTPDTPIPDTKPDPQKPWALTKEDRVFLRVQRIDTEDATTPYPEPETLDDGA